MEDRDEDAGFDGDYLLSDVFTDIERSGPLRVHEDPTAQFARIEELRRHYAPMVASLLEAGHSIVEHARDGTLEDLHELVRELRTDEVLLRHPPVAFCEAALAGQLHCAEYIRRRGLSVSNLPTAVLQQYGSNAGPGPSKSFGAAASAIERCALLEGLVLRAATATDDAEDTLATAEQSGSSDDLTAATIALRSRPDVDAVWHEDGPSTADAGELRQAGLNLLLRTAETLVGQFATWCRQYNLQLEPSAVAAAAGSSHAGERRLRLPKDVRAALNAAAVDAESSGAGAGAGASSSSSVAPADAGVAAFLTSPLVGRSSAGGSGSGSGFVIRDALGAAAVLQARRAAAEAAALAAAAAAALPPASSGAAAPKPTRISSGVGHYGDASAPPTAAAAGAGAAASAASEGPAAAAGLSQAAALTTVASLAPVAAAASSPAASPEEAGNDASAAAAGAAASPPLPRLLLPAPPFMIAAYLILCGGEGPNGVRPHDGCTPLHLAAEAGLPRLTAALLLLGADVHAVSAAGETPLGAALRGRKDSGCDAPAPSAASTQGRGRAAAASPLSAAAGSPSPSASAACAQARYAATAALLRLYGGVTSWKEAVRLGSAEVAEAAAAAASSAAARSGGSAGSMSSAAAGPPATMAEALARMMTGEGEGDGEAVEFGSAVSAAAVGGAGAGVGAVGAADSSASVAGPSSSASASGGSKPRAAAAKVLSVCVVDATCGGDDVDVDASSGSSGSSGTGGSSTAAAVGGAGAASPPAAAAASPAAGKALVATTVASTGQPGARADSATAGAGSTTAAAAGGKPAGPTGRGGQPMPMSSFVGGFDMAAIKRAYEARAREEAEAAAAAAAGSASDSVP